MKSGGLPCPHCSPFSEYISIRNPVGRDSIGRIVPLIRCRSELSNLGGYIMSDHSKRLKLKGRVLALGAFIGAALFATSDLNPLKAAGPVAQASSSYTEFESGQVRPIAISPDRTRLLAV